MLDLIHLLVIKWDVHRLLVHVVTQRAKIICHSTHENYVLGCNFKAQFPQTQIKTMVVINGHHSRRSGLDQFRESRSVWLTMWGYFSGSVTLMSVSLMFRYCENIKRNSVIKRCIHQWKRILCATYFTAIPDLQSVGYHICCNCIRQLVKSIAEMCASHFDFYI